MLEFLEDELQRRKSTHLQQQTPFSAFFKERPAPITGQRRRLTFWNENPFNDGQESLVPLTQSGRVPPAEPCEGLLGLFERSPPLEGGSASQYQGDIELRLQILCSVSFQFKVTVPRHLCRPAMEKGVGVVEKARMTRVLDGRESASGYISGLEAQDL